MVETWKYRESRYSQSAKLKAEDLIQCVIKEPEVLLIDIVQLAYGTDGKGIEIGAQIGPSARWLVASGEC